MEVVNAILVPVICLGIGYLVARDRISRNVDDNVAMLLGTQQARIGELEARYTELARDFYEDDGDRE